MYRIPFNKPTLVGKEIDYITQAIHEGHSAGGGYFTRQCQDLIARELGTHKVLLTTSCTDALEMAALLLGIQPGDEVIVPSFTFVSTANAFVLRGARPVFIDIRPDTLNMDESQLERLITGRTRAIVPVHYAGVGCDMDGVCRVAARHGIPVVEDNAHGLFGKYKGRFLGTFGTLAAQSFHETKNFICGEGGAILINEPGLVERAEIVWEKGTNRSRFFRGEVDKYTWVDVGSSYLPSDILAAFLFAQLEARATIQEKRRMIWNRYYEQLRDWAELHNVRLPFVPDCCEQPYHLFYILPPSAEFRQALIDHLKADGILSVFHYLPLHLSPMGQRLGAADGDCPVTERIAARILRLPFYYDLTEAEQDSVIRAIRAFTPQAVYPARNPF